MKVLIGCEESGQVRRAFRARGHEAWSNDLEPARDESPYHYQCDVYDALGAKDWDIIILHPECTTVALSGNRHYAGTEARIKQIQWIKKLFCDACEIANKGVALENPASAIWPVLRPLSSTVQFIQPWMFGHPEQKMTGLALVGLPPLVATKNVKAEMEKLPAKERNRVHYMSPGPDRAKFRSETYSGIAEAMASQWG